jgi:cytochrome b involved in lipid metabolism
MKKTILIILGLVIVIGAILAAFASMFLFAIPSNKVKINQTTVSSLTAVNNKVSLTTPKAPITNTKETSSTESEESSIIATETSSTAAASTEATDSKTLTLATVATHNSEADCWIHLNNKVYNLTEYAPKHPGGKGKILKYCGSGLDSIKNHPGGDLLGAVIKAIISPYYVGDIQ